MPVLRLTPGWSHRKLIQVVAWANRPSRRFHVLSTGAIILMWLLFGIYAIYGSLPESDLSGPGRFFEVLYRTLRLLGGSDNLEDYQDDSNRLLLSMEFARWLGLVLPFWIAVPPLLGWVLRTSEERIAGDCLAGHYVVLGYGQIGQPLVRDLLVANKLSPSRAVVVIDDSAAPGRLNAAKTRGAITLVRDARDITAFDAAGAERAHAILVATGESSRNIDLAGRLAEHIRTRLKQNAHGAGRSERLTLPKIVPHIAERRLMDWAKSSEGNRWLKGTHAGNDAPPSYRPAIHPFSADQTALRQLLGRRPIATHAALRPVSRAHIVILGFDSIADWLIPQVLQAGLIQGLKGPRVTLICDSGVHGTDADGVQQRIARMFPFLDEGEVGSAPELKAHLGIEFSVADYDFDALDSTLLDLTGHVPTDVQSVDDALAGVHPKPVDRRTIETFGQAPAPDPVTAIFVCFGNDDRNLDVALRLQQLIRQHCRWRAPTFVRLHQDSGLEEVLSRSDRQMHLDQVIDDFGQDDTVCTRREIFESRCDSAALEAHRVYVMGERLTELAKRLAAGYSPQKPWKTIGSQWSRYCKANELPAIGQIFTTMADHRQPTNHDVVQWLSELETSTLDRRIDAINSLLAEICEPKGENADERTRKGDHREAQLKFQYAVSNRDQVAHLRVKLRGLGYRDVAFTRASGTGGTTAKGTLSGPWPMPDATAGQIMSFQLACGHKEYEIPLRIKQAARLEHDRWMVERLMSGWRYAPNRDNIRLHHPSLRPYQALAKDRLEQLKDERTVLDLWSVLAETDPAEDWRPECTIGVIAPALDISEAQRNALQKLLKTKVLNTITKLHASVLCNDFVPVVKTSTNPDKHDAAKAARSLAISLMSSLDDGPSVVAAATGYSWAITADDTSGTPRPFRLIVPRGVPFTTNDFAASNDSDSTSVEALDLADDAGLRSWLTDIGKTGTDRFDDWWIIDLAPEGLVAEAISRDEPDSKDPRRNSLQADDRLSLDDLKRGLREDLRKREIAYIVERADWLLVIELADMPTSSNSDKHEPATDPANLAWHWRRFNAAVPRGYSSCPSGSGRPRSPTPSSSLLTDGWEKAHTGQEDKEHDQSQNIYIMQGPPDSIDKVQFDVKAACMRIRLI